jgi:hypothetical protein
MDEIQAGQENPFKLPEVDPPLLRVLPLVILLSVFSGLVTIFLLGAWAWVEIGRGFQGFD